MKINQSIPQWTINQLLCEILSFSSLLYSVHDFLVLSSFKISIKKRVRQSGTFQTNQEALAHNIARKKAMINFLTGICLSHEEFLTFLWSYLLLPYIYYLLLLLLKPLMRIGCYFIAILTKRLRCRISIYARKSLYIDTQRSLNTVTHYRMNT